MKDLPIRTAIAVILLGLLFCVIYFGGLVQAIVLSIFCAISVFELGAMFRRRDIRPCVIPQALLAATQFITVYLCEVYKLSLGYVALLYIAAFIAIIIERILNPRRTALDSIAALFITIYPVALLLCMGLIGYGRSDFSRIAMFTIFSGPCMADNTAYFVGSWLGKRKLCPAISPNKTVAGAIGGVIGGVLGGVLSFFVQKLWGFDIPLYAHLVIGLIGGIIGQFGDLFASTFKRWSGIKDYGHILPGHGGITDRLDSTMMFAPVVMIIFKLFIR